MKKLTIAIDGHASTGKSSIAKEIAIKYGYIYINSGSMYRAVTLFAIENKLLGLLNDNIDLFIEKLKDISINFRFNQNNLISEIFLNNRNVEKEIGSLEVSNYVSKVAAIPEIRKEMVKLQRNIDRRKGVVMDGRDIGSVVFPNADIKLFLTASDTVRANRRFEEMINNGLSVSYDEILNNIRNRDKLDSSRSDSPLIIEKDAIVIDNSNMSIDEQIKQIKQLIDRKIAN
jgi:cytidylate kinase|tara:strand:- start:7470 stop:8159 length:690 start_codon:yes stop_codon:yes gene_type:complete